MGIGMALTEGTLLDEDGRQRNPHLLDYKLQTMCRRAADQDRLRRDRHAERAGRRARRASASRRACRRPARSRTRSRKVTGAQVDRLPMTPERVWEAMQPVTLASTSSAARRSRRRWRRRRAARARWPAAPIWWSAPARARRRCPTRSSPSTGSTAARDRRVRRRPAPGRAGHATSELGRRPGRARALHGRSPTPRRSSARHATRHVGTIGGNVDERVAGDGDGRAADLPRRGGRAALAVGRAAGQRRGAVHRPRQDQRPARRAADRDRPAGDRRRHRRCYVRLEYRRADGDRDRRRDRAWSTLDGDAITDARVAITALAPTIRRVAGGRAGADRRRRRPDGRARGGRPARRPPRRPISDVRGSDRLPAGDGRRDRAGARSMPPSPAPAARTCRFPRVPPSTARSWRREHAIHRDATGQRRHVPGRDRARPQPAVGAARPSSG